MNIVEKYSSKKFSPTNHSNLFSIYTIKKWYTLYYRAEKTKILAFSDL